MLSFFLLFFWRTGFTLFSWKSLSAELCNGNEKKHYLFLTICHKIHGKREVFHMYVNWKSVLRVVPSTSEPKVCSLMPALESREFISLKVIRGCNEQAFLEPWKAVSWYLNLFTASLSVMQSIALLGRMPA